VHQRVGIFPVLVQQFNIEFAAPGSDWEAKQKQRLFDLLYQSTHLLSGEMGMAISANEARFSIGGNKAQECPG
jgi:hypothetical protein